MRYFIYIFFFISIVLSLFHSMRLVKTLRIPNLRYRKHKRERGRERERVRETSFVA